MMFETLMALSSSSSSSSSAAAAAAAESLSQLAVAIRYKRFRRIQSTYNLPNHVT
jgi:hypothetical protein